MRNAAMSPRTTDRDHPAAGWTRRPIVDLVCPEHQGSLTISGDGAQLLCREGCTYAVVDGIPRFVPRVNYARGFGLQWNTFRTTQLDSQTHTTVSADRLRRIAGGNLRTFDGKTILEAGCGAGRFTEVLLASGAKVFAADLSDAVDANASNCGHFPDYFVCQADILRLPVRPETFDIVLCIGVVQHTPDPEATMAALCRHLRPGGVLLMDHYSPDYAATRSRRALRRALLPLPPALALGLCRALVSGLWPIHRLTFALRTQTIFDKVRQWWVRLSPVVDYQDAYPQLGDKLLFDWAILDTHDTLTDRYKHLRSASQLVDHLRSCGMDSVSAKYAGNGVEVRATKTTRRDA
jgi:SAM-dependent methyltransferase